MLDRVLQMPGTSYVVMPQKQIGYGLIDPNMVTPSLNGHALAFVGTAPNSLVDATKPITRGLYAHRVNTGRTSLLMRLRPEQGIGFMHWLGDRLAIVSYRDNTMELAILGPNENQSRNVTSWRENFRVEPADDENPKPPSWPAGSISMNLVGGTNQALFMIAQTSLTSYELWVLGSSGQIRRQPLDLGSVSLAGPTLMSDGLIALDVWSTAGSNYTVLDPTTGRLFEKEYPEPSDERGFQVQRASRIEATKKTLPKRALVLSTYGYDPQPDPALITNDGGGGEVMPGRQAVWFVDTFGLYLCELLAVDTEQLEAMMKEAVKVDAILRAKQVGVGMMIYGADYDDYLPLSGDWENSLMPYLKNGELMNGFVYLGNGENLSNLKDPANQVLGYIDTPYGRAIVRMDSSVKWEDKPQTLALDRRWWDHRYQAARL